MEFKTLQKSRSSTAKCYFVSIKTKVCTGNSVSCLNTAIIQQWQQQAPLSAGCLKTPNSSDSKSSIISFGRTLNKESESLSDNVTQVSINLRAVFDSNQTFEDQITSSSTGLFLSGKKENTNQSSFQSVNVEKIKFTYVYGMLHPDMPSCYRIYKIVQYKLHYIVFPQTGIRS